VHPSCQTLGVTPDNMTVRFSQARMLFAGALLCFISASCQSQKTQMSEIVLTRESVVDFLNRFEEIAEKESFDLIQDLIHDNAVFRFNDGDFVGKSAIRAAFEKTWKGSEGVKKERFYLTEIQVLTVDARSATATYTYNWQGSMNGQSFLIRGRGTRVLVVEAGRLQIIHEHLSRYPKQ
jgi:ketosteroid isomerase-like protein